MPSPPPPHAVTCGPAHPARWSMVTAARGRKKPPLPLGLSQPHPHWGKPQSCPSQGTYLSGEAPLNPKGPAVGLAWWRSGGAAVSFLPEQLLASRNSGFPAPAPGCTASLSPPTTGRDAPPSTVGLPARAAAKRGSSGQEDRAVNAEAPLTLGDKQGASPLKLLPVVTPYTPIWPHLPVLPVPQTSLAQPKWAEGAGRQLCASTQGLLWAHSQGRGAHCLQRQVRKSGLAPQAQCP